MRRVESGWRLDEDRNRATVEKLDLDQLAKLLGRLRDGLSEPGNQGDAALRKLAWDALDVIGIQCYFPLVEHEELPTQEELDIAWSELIERLESYSRTHNRRIIMGELGYNRSLAAATRP